MYSQFWFNKTFSLFYVLFNNRILRNKLFSKTNQKIIFNSFLVTTKKLKFNELPLTQGSWFFFFTRTLLNRCIDWNVFSDCFVSKIFSINRLILFIIYSKTTSIRVMIFLTFVEWYLFLKISQEYFQRISVRSL